MEITGCDLVIFTFEQPRVVFARVLASILKRWPMALVEDLDLGAATVPVPGRDLTIEQLPVDQGVLLFLRDEAMNLHMENHAYTPMHDGDGPFAIHSRVRRSIEFACSALDEIQVIDEPVSFVKTSLVNAPDPYEAWICTPLIYEITVVTPDDPTSHGFSSWVMEIAKQACAGPGRTMP
jgi:hypothetical protein